MGIIWGLHFCSFSSIYYWLYSAYIWVTIKITPTISVSVSLQLWMSSLQYIYRSLVLQRYLKSWDFSPLVVFLVNSKYYCVFSVILSFILHSTRRVSLSGNIQFFSLCAHLWHYYDLILFHLTLFTKNALMTGLWKIQINNVTLFSQRQPGLHTCQIKHNR